MPKCKGITQKGYKCERTVLNGNYCWQHEDQDISTTPTFSFGAPASPDYHYTSSPVYHYPSSPQVAPTTKQPLCKLCGMDYGYPAYDNYCYKHYLMSKNGNLPSSSAPAPSVSSLSHQMSSLNIHEEKYSENEHPTTVGEAFSVYALHKPYVDNAKNDPKYKNFMYYFQDTKHFAENKINHLPTRVRKHIKKYTEGKHKGENFHVALNKYLNDPHAYKDKYLQNAADELHRLAFDVKLPAMVVWRGIQPYPGFAAEYQIGKIITVNNLLSTSYNEYDSLEFVGHNCCMLQIYIPRGAFGVPLESQSKYTEHEILFPIGMKCVVVDIRQKYINGKNMRYYICVFIY